MYTNCKETIHKFQVHVFRLYLRAFSHNSFCSVSYGTQKRHDVWGLVLTFVSFPCDDMCDSDSSSWPPLGTLSVLRPPSSDPGWSGGQASWRFLSSACERRCLVGFRSGNFICLCSEFYSLFFLKFFLVCCYLNTILDPYLLKKPLLIGQSWNARPHTRAVSGTKRWSCTWPLAMWLYAIARAFHALK